MIWEISANGVKYRYLLGKMTITPLIWENGHGDT